MLHCCWGAWIHIWSHHRTPASPGGPQQRIDPLSPTAHPKLQYTNIPKNKKNNYLGRTAIYQYTKNPKTNPRWFIRISILVLQQMLVFWFFGILVYCSFGWAVGGSGPMCCQGAWIHIWSHHKTPASPGGLQQRIDPLSPTAHPKLQYTNIPKN